MKNLKYSNDIIDEVRMLVRNHDAQMVGNNKFIRRMLNKMGKETFEKLIALRYADIMGQSEYAREENLKEVEEVKRALAEFKVEDECFSLKQLKIDGNTLIKMGIKPGKEMGQLLNKLFNMVVEEEIENDPNKLKDYVRKEMNI